MVFVWIEGGDNVRVVYMQVFVGAVGEGPTCCECMTVSLYTCVMNECMRLLLKGWE